MYRRVKLSAGNMTDYGMDLPESYRKLVLSGEYQAIAITDDNIDGSTYVGVCVWFELDEWIEVVYIHMKETRTPMVEKSDFIKCCIHEIREFCTDNPRGAFIEIPTKESTDDAKAALSLVGMDVKESYDNMYEFKMSEVTGTEVLKTAFEKGGCIALSEADEAMLDRLETLMQNDERPIPVPVFMDWAKYLSDMSFVYVRKGEPRGAVLISEYEDSLAVELAYAADAMALPLPLANAYYAIMGKYGQDQKILIPVVVNKTSELVERMVPTARRNKIVEGVIRF